MTKNEFMDKYNDVEFIFSRYYKYTFTFEGVTEDGKTVILSCGGGSSEIYRYEVVAGQQMIVKVVDALCGSGKTTWCFDYMKKNSLLENIEWSYVVSDD